MKNANATNGRLKGLQNSICLGTMLMAATFITPSAPAASASKSVTAGSSVFGAKASVSYHDYISGDMYRGSVLASADGKVLGLTVPLASGSSTLEVQPSNCHAYGYVKLAGVTKATWDTSFDATKTFTTPSFVKSLTGASTRIWFGPVPVTIKAGAKVSIYGKGKVTMSLSPDTGLPVVQGSVGPVMDAAATLSAGVGLAFAGVDVRGSLTLVGVGLTGSMTYAPQVTGNPVVTYRVTAGFHWTDGAIKVCAWVDPPFVSRKEWCKTLYQFGGTQSSYVILSGSTQL